MIVRATRLINVAGEEVPHIRGVTIGHDYLVLEIWVDPLLRKIRILDEDGGSPSLWPLDMFEVVSPRISANWGAAIKTVDGRTYLDLAPVAWLRPGFWQDYFDRGWEGAIKEFDRAVAEMAAEEGLPPDGRIARAG